MTTEADVDDRAIEKMLVLLVKQKTLLYRTEERSEQGTLGGLIFEPPPPRRFKDQTSSSLRARSELNPQLIFLYIKKPALKT